MNLNPPHIKRTYCLLAVLTFFLLLAALQSPAQRPGKRHKHHAGRLPDSVSTSEEEIKPFAPDTVVSSVGTGNLPSDTVISAPPVSDVQQDGGVVKTDSSSVEEPAPAPVLRSIPDTAIRGWKNSHDFDYANDPSMWKEDEPEQENLLERFFNSDAFRYFIYILLGSALLFALYKIIAENNLRFFYKKPVRVAAAPLTEAELPEEDLDQLLKKALEEKEYRMATRYLYLRTLRQLDAKELIRWHSQATDEEYVRQMNSQPQGDRFRWLTSAYERVWYGKFLLDDQQFSRLLQYFQDFSTAVEHPHRA